MRICTIMLPDDLHNIVIQSKNNFSRKRRGADESKSATEDQPGLQASMPSKVRVN